MFIGFIIVIMAIGFVFRRNLVASLSPTPATIGLQNGKLAPCPTFPNCVSTDATDTLHQIAAISVAGSATQAQDKLVGALKAMPNVTLVTNTPGYIHAEFRSASMSFIDDAEFVISSNGNSSSIGLRSASRLGRGDMGLNRRNMELVRAAVN